MSALLCMGATSSLFAAEAAAEADAARDAYEAGLKALAWVKGPTSVPVSGNASLTIPENYVFLDAANTAKFEELNENLSNGKEVMVAPSDLHWSAYLEFDEGGYVKDNEKIDAGALLKSLQEGTESNNEERVKRGWSALHVLGWASAPAYNSDTKRLEWATTLRSEGGTGVNFFTKILGRRGHTSIVMVSSQSGLPEAETSLNAVLDGYAYNQGESYAEWKPGDKVAEYGLAALVLGGAAAVATKKGLWAVIASFMAAAWKAVAAAVVGVGAWLRNRFKKKD
jgi:uncharacterized membrane-anchored protein